MPRVKLTNKTDDDGNPISFEAVGEWPSYDGVLEAHGYDPESTDYDVDDPDADLHDAIQSASDLSELKDALTSDNHPTQANGRGRGLR
jgi:hypothetical protein